MPGNVIQDRAPKGFDHGWWMDDEKIAYPMLEQARKLNVKRVCVHKGLPLGTVPEYNHPKDLIKAAKDFPDIDFLVYHSGMKSAASIDEAFEKAGEIPWTTEFCPHEKSQPRAEEHLHGARCLLGGELLSTARDGTSSRPMRARSHRDLLSKRAACRSSLASMSPSARQCGK